ncbi:dihydroorotate dehydrogenase electron transfer subunit [Candidatus Caldatribacterium sp.]|uniref:dihydroorotate dehydrogenase electron transfer subunit n=1 Tax=Candidatus Caldatribacterium sp. TaxID=2282143 RepID=UPI002993696D|nr:dihydroorotate dehydrogenase electron transfer subunit [Candidatus Caldatribacterium sp.]MDW8081399.1 dihydroorotate dehydrogenase electron transfer subunit [Candidatus Calescibacterium sp.]
MRLAQIRKKEKVGERFVLLEVEEESIATRAKPGQFVMVRPFEGVYDPILPRPFAILRTEGNCFTLLFEIVGRGTFLLSHLEPGDNLRVLGPLGRGFSLETPRAVLIGGGRGIVPLVFLAIEFTKRGIPFAFFAGFREKGELSLLRVLEGITDISWSCEEKVAGGFCGTVLGLFEKHLDVVCQSNTRIYACGPEGMLRGLAKALQGKEEVTEVSLEARMGCGFGVCLGCVVPRKNGGYWHVCSDGPVFRLSEVVL